MYISYNYSKARGYKILKEITSLWGNLKLDMSLFNINCRKAVAVTIKRIFPILQNLLFLHNRWLVGVTMVCRIVAYPKVYVLNKESPTLVVLCMIMIGLGFSAEYRHCYIVLCTTVVWWYNLGRKVQMTEKRDLEGEESGIDSEGKEKIMKQEN